MRTPLAELCRDEICDNGSYRLVIALLQREREKENRMIAVFFLPFLRHSCFYPEGGYLRVVGRRKSGRIIGLHLTA